MRVDVVGGGFGGVVEQEKGWFLERSGMEISFG